MGNRPLRPRAIVVYAFCAVIVMLFSCAFLLERTVAQGQTFQSNLPVQYRELRSESSGDVFAVVKGSIYENGSNMTVFGACQNARGALLPNATATFTAWYPNGTVMMGPNTSMLHIYDGANTTGRFRIHITMPDVIGTYFTEMRCEYKNDFGLAFGEWQNPEWVFKIGQTLSAVLGLNLSMTYLNQTLYNLSNKIDVYQNITQENLSQLYSLVSNINSSSGMYDDKLKEIYNLKYDLSRPRWVVDGQNVVYVMGSGANNFVAVDILDRSNVVAVGDSGEIAAWNGDSWQYLSVSNTSWLGVSILPAPVQYYWSAGLMGPKPQPVEISFSGGPAWTGLRTPVYSINGGPALNVTEPWFVNATMFVDVEVFNQPNKPGTDYYALLLADNGQVLYTQNAGANWTDFMGLYGASYGGTGLGRISNVVANVNNATEGFRVALVSRSGHYAYFDGFNVTTGSIPGVSLADISLLRDGTAYLVGLEQASNRTIVYKYLNGTLSVEYQTQGWVLPAGISAIAEDDIWLATADPAVMYHYDGFKWEYMADDFTAGLGITISFGGFNTTMYGVRDMSVVGSTGYAVGADGMIMKLWSVWDERFDRLLNATNTSIWQLQQIVLAMNASLMNETNIIQLKLDQMNVTQQEILSNVTYINQYLTTYVGPALGDILAYLGIIEGRINTTIELQNETLQKVDDLVAKSERPRTWTTQ